MRTSVLRFEKQGYGITILYPFLSEYLFNYYLQIVIFLSKSYICNS